MASDRPSDPLREQLVELSPSAKYVFKVLEYNGTLTQSELAERTLLPKRTIRYALDKLEAAGLVEKAIDSRDARCRMYSPNVSVRVSNSKDD